MKDRSSMLAQRVANALSEVVGILHGITKADIDSADSAGVNVETCP
jgi:predicted transcriptional regulator